jgi:hypothetical protein
MATDAVSEPESHPGELHRLAYELSLHALNHQENSVDELRNRTGTLLAASSLVASFLGSRAIDTGGVSWLFALALTAFGLSVLASIYVLLPKENLIFAIRGSVLFEEEFAEPGGLAETHRRLAYWLEGYRDQNQPTVDRLFRRYRWAASAVLVQVILWSVDLGVN